MSTPRYIPEDEKRLDRDEDEVVTPSQAEGDNTEEQGDDGQGHVQPTPSQAEGDREAIERRLEEKQ